MNTTDINERAARVAPLLAELTGIVIEHLLTLENPSSPNMAEIQDILRPKLEQMKDREFFMDLVSLAAANLIREKIKYSLGRMRSGRSGSDDSDSVTE